MTAGVSGMVCSALTNNDSGGEWDGAFSSEHFLFVTVLDMMECQEIDLGILAMIKDDYREEWWNGRTPYRERVTAGVCGGDTDIVI